MGVPFGEQLLWIIVLLSIHWSLAERLPYIRGVDASRFNFYMTNSGNFTCIDGLSTIQFDKVNDDYCDCADGSDEPGTAACPHTEFNCANLGYRAENIPSSRVNDGICDCCDASDEYASGSECVDTCLYLGQKEQELRKAQETLFENGAALCGELINKGKQLKAGRLVRLLELKQRKSDMETIRNDKLKSKNQAEDAEAEALQVYKRQERENEAVHKAGEQPTSNLEEAQKTFIKYDTNKDGFVDVAELQYDILLDKDGNGAVTEEEVSLFLDKHDRVDLNSFVASTWPKIKTQIMISQGIFEPPITEKKQQADVHMQSQSETEESVANGYAEESEDNQNDDFERDVYDDEEEADVGEGVVVEDTASTPDYDPDTQRVIEIAKEARRAFSEVDNQLREIENEIKEIEKQNAKDYGTDEEFATLDGQCFTYEDREYVYKLCPFDRASQQQRSGGSETTLGRWNEWNGSERNKYFEMKYSHGASCWNGPQRSATVQLKCGLENKITSVTEPNRCEYYFHFETPACCKKLPETHNDLPHDEL